MRSKTSSKAAAHRGAIIEETRSQFARLLAPKLMQALRADLRGSVRLRPAQRTAMREMLEKFMPPAALKKAMSNLRAVAAAAQAKPTRGFRARRSRQR